MTDQSNQRTIGRYVIESKLGQGGMAEVYCAYDPQFQRRVAIKVLPAYLLQMDPTFAARFRREALTIASLEHPAIVPVYDSGEADGHPYLVMRLMIGGSLEDRLMLGPMSLNEASELFTRIAPAIDKAHAKGIIHRDLKPGNILFDEEGSPYLADFGIVRLQDSTTTLTQGGIVGTPAYMSPEQAKGRKDLDGRSDIYSLGAILFHMLSGKLPYESDTPHGYLMCHINDPVPVILEFLPHASAELQAVITTAMAKEKQERYPNARAFAIAVEEAARKEQDPASVVESVNKTVIEPTPSFRAPPEPEVTLDERGMPASDRQPSPVLNQHQSPLQTRKEVLQPVPSTRVQPQAKQRAGILKYWPWLAGLGALAVIIILFIGLSGGFPGRASSTTQPVVAGVGLNPTETVTPSPGGTAVPTTTSSPTSTAVPTTTRFPTDTPQPTPTPAPSMMTGSEPIYNLNAGRVNELDLIDTQPLLKLSSIALSPDMSLMASGTWDGPVYLWRVSDGALLYTLEGHTSLVLNLTFSPDGQTLASASIDNTVRLWRVSDGAQLNTLEGDSRPVHSVAFSPDGQTLASGTEDGMIYLWRVSDSVLLNTLQGQPTIALSMSFSPDGQTLAIGFRDGTIQLWRARDGVLLDTMERRSDGVYSLAFSPDGTILAAGSADGSIQVWRVSDGALLHNLSGHTAYVTSLAFSLDSTTLASGSGDNTIRLWQLPSGPLLVTLRNTTGLGSVAFSPDGTILASVDFDGMIRLWGVPQP